MRVIDLLVRFIRLVFLLAVAGTSVPCRGDNLAFSLPEPMQEEDVKFISRWMMLSEAQQAAFAAIVSQYHESHLKLVNTRLARIRELAEIGGSLVTQGYPPECVDACEKFFAAQDDYLREMVTLDANVLAALQSILSEKQLPSLRHIELWRERRRCLMTGWDLRTAGIDLEMFALGVLPSNDQDVLDSIRGVLNDYAEAVTPSFVSADRAGTRRTLDGVRIFADASIAPQDRAALISAKHKSAAQREVELAELNARFAAQIIKALPPTLGRTFKDAFDEETLPLTYPDLPVSEACTKLLLTSESLTDEQRAEIEGEWAVHSKALNGIIQTMAKRENDWNAGIAASRSLEGRDEFAEFMRAGRLRRWELHQEYLKGLLRTFPTIFSNEQSTQVAGTINDIALLIHQSKDDGYPLMRSMNKMRSRTSATN